MQDPQPYIILVRLHHDPNSYSLSNGSWSSHYKISNGKITGTVAINAHNFENGNVHFKDVKNA
jgi:hypothetical protein